ncbi:MAG: hypothetical protein ACR2GP_07750 [Burkholderiaceae bacterium]
MKIDHTIRLTDGTILAAIVIALTILAGLVAYNTGDDAFQQLQPEQSVAARVPVWPVEAREPVLVADAPTLAHPSGAWAADQSAAGTRPDSSH